MTISTREFSGTYLADRDHSSILFSVRHMNVSVFRAAFADVSALVVADEDGVMLEGEAHVDSISISNPQFREHVVNGPDFFDARAHPAINFRSERVEFAGGGGVQVQGELTIKGISKRVTATGSYRPPVEDPFGTTRAALELQTTVDRREWGLNWQMPLPAGGDALGYDVEVTVHLELTKEG